MKRPDLSDSTLSGLLSKVVLLLVMALVYLAILLPFSKEPGAVSGAIVALATLIGGIIGARAKSKSRGNDDA